MSDHYMRSGGRVYRLVQQAGVLFYAVEGDEPVNEDEQARLSSALLPTVNDVKAFNAKADGYFIVRYDGGGEYVLWFIDYRGSQAGRYGEPVERWIRTYKEAAPDASTAAAHARQWLADNAWWL